MLIYPARLLECNQQGGDLNPTVLLFHFLHLWMWENALGQEQQKGWGAGRGAVY